MSGSVRPVVVRASIVTDDPQQVTRAMEALSRAIAGLALEGIDVALEAATVDGEQAETEAP